MALDDFLADSQTDTSTGILILGVEALENLEDAIEVLPVNPNPIILDAKLPSVLLTHSFNIHQWRLIGAAVLDGIANQILK